MAKKDKKMMLIGAAALAALYFWNKNKNEPEFIMPKKSEAKPQAVNTPIVTMANATPRMFNPVNNALNNLKPQKLTAKKGLTNKSFVDTRKLTANSLNGVTSIF